MIDETRMPALFLGHGNPMNAINENEYARAWASLGASLPRPRAVLCISAHWYLPATLVTGDQQPKTIHDFGGFPPPLFDVQYPAPGDPQLAQQVADLLAPEGAERSAQWGLDHGAWSVLRHMYPDADVPVVQLSLNDTQEAAWHFDLARRLRPLRDDNILIIGSGNLVHNLREYAWGKGSVEPHDWALRFEDFARECMSAANFDPLIGYKDLGKDAMMSVPTPDHYLPLMYALAQYHDGDRITYPVDGFDGGSMSMLAVQIGG